ncbi:MAG: phosphate regulon sensor histidine kinase PhoR, partial [Betaproteobacteria bacterium]
WCNPKAEDYFGLDYRRDRGQQITYILRQPQFVEHLSSARPGEPLALKMMRPGGEIVLSVQQVPYGDSRKLLLGRDITRWERLETTRRDFVANVSHELRTPLTVVGGFLETLDDMDTPDAEMSKRAIALMRQQTDRMVRLVEDLLTLSRLESTHNALRDEDVNVPELLRALHQDALVLSAGRHRIRVKLESAEWLKGNTEELRSAFGNLISNAVRYTPENGEIEIRWETPDGQPAFAVHDSGIGIEPQHIDRLTERFYRVDRSRSRETGGTGLGLAIVKHVLNRHQARLDIQSTLGNGSTFSVVFPDVRRLAAGQASAAKVPA